MTSHQDQETPAAADFERLFADEPAVGDPAADLRRGRRRRGRRRVLNGVVATVAAVAVGGTAFVALHGEAVLVGPVAGPSAVPAPPSALSSPTPTGASSPSPTPGRTAAPRDTAPVLRRDAEGNYLDADGYSLRGSIMHRDPDVNPFRATTRNSWELARRHLDPSADHLRDYDESAFTGGGTGAGMEIGQKLGWAVQGDPGEGMIQLAVSRPLPGETLQLGTGKTDAAGFCTSDFLSGTSCRRTTVAGVEVYLADTSDGGFVMDHRQADGEVASVVVSPVFGNNTDVPLRAIRITPAAAAALLSDPALDVVG